MKYKDIKDLSKDELQKKKREVNEELFLAKMKNSMGQLNNPVRIRFFRRDIARIQTALKHKN